MNLMTVVTGENLYKTRVGVTDLGGEIIKRTFGNIDGLYCLQVDLNINMLIVWMEVFLQ